MANKLQNKNCCCYCCWLLLFLWCFVVNENSYTTTTTKTTTATMCTNIHAHTDIQTLTWETRSNTTYKNKLILTHWRPTSETHRARERSVRTRFSLQICSSFLIISSCWLAIYAMILTNMPSSMVAWLMVILAFCKITHDEKEKWSLNELKKRTSSRNWNRYAHTHSCRLRMQMRKKEERFDKEARRANRAVTRRKVYQMWLNK